VNNLVTSWIRTGVPYIVSAAASWLIAKGIDVSPEASAAAVTALTLVIGNVYYVVVRKLEQKWPQYGWLLGVAVQPTYQQKK
jgi:hypothetical protein